MHAGDVIQLSDLTDPTIQGTVLVVEAEPEGNALFLPALTR